MHEYSPFEWLLIDLANHAGQDKELYEDRIQWSKDNLPVLEALVDDIPAKSKPLFAKTMLAIRDVQKGLPTGHIVHLDSAASGPQLISTALKCTTGMTNTGVLNTGNVPDAYRTLTEHMGMENVYPRKVVKNAFMTGCYGSKANPLQTFGEEHLPVFEEAALKTVPLCWMLKDYIISKWDPTKDVYHAVLPDGFTVHKRIWVTKDYKITEPLLDNRSFTFRCKVNEPKEFSLELAAHIAHILDGFVVRETRRRCQYTLHELLDARAEILKIVTTDKITCRKAFVSLVGVEHIKHFKHMGDNYLLRLLELIDLSLRDKSFQLTVIHDSFGCSPVYVNTLRKHYNRILFDMYHSDIIADLIHQLVGEYVNLPDVDEAIANKILDAEYPIN